MSQIEDLDAINVYISGAKNLTPEAVPLRDSWIAWFNGLGFWERNFESNTYNIGRNKRDAFVRAMAVTEADKKAAATVQKKGLTTEEMFGKPSVKTSTGFYEEPVPLIPEKYKVAAAVAGGVTVAAIVAKKLKLI